MACNKHIDQGLANFLCMGQDSKHFELCGSKFKIFAVIVCKQLCGFDWIANSWRRPYNKIVLTSR